MRSPTSAAELFYEDGTPIEALKPAEIDAEVPSAIGGVAEIAIECDNSGAPITGQLPKNVPYKLIRRGVDETAGATWSLAVLSGTITATIAAGVMSITAIGSMEAVVRLTAVFGTTTRESTVQVIKSIGAAPPSGGGGGAGTTQSGGLAGSITSTTPVVIAGPFTINVGANGRATLTAPFTFTTTNATPTGSFGLNVQWQEWNGSAWVGLGSTIPEDFGSFVYSDEGTRIVEPGSVTANYPRTGLTANSTGLQFRLVAWLPSGTRPRYPSGTASAVGD